MASINSSQYSLLPNIKTDKTILYMCFVRVGGRMYVLGGEEGLDRHHDTIEVYDPVKDSWSVAGHLTSSRSWLSAAPITIRFASWLLLDSSLFLILTDSLTHVTLRMSRHLYPIVCYETITEKNNTARPLSPLFSFSYHLYFYPDLFSQFFW